ncbi:CrcB family protein [Streptomyces sp. TRM66268-LWL]|uniref:Fluoride-specific ion channel FluC n=1 Tax=Streptomyces polyasparticus TaxID=2767826 RepID=A0ABR7SHQ5_9ACTN|nr:CrcB family protein [Streptomyces polyasparticus]MBC9715051.1 CrcB family protein [Streptomyces polyasparticus]
MNWLLVLAGGMLGAPLRYLTDRAVQSRHTTGFPWGTFTANMTGSLLLGFLTGAALSSHAMLFLATGLCGALTTYSTFSYETLTLSRTGAGVHTIANALGSVLAGLGAAYVGLALAQSLLG